MSVESKFSRELTLARRRLGLTQERAADRLSISTRWYQEIENGRRLPGALLTLKIIAFFGIDGARLRSEEAEADELETV